MASKKGDRNSDYEMCAVCRTNTYMQIAQAYSCRLYERLLDIAPRLKNAYSTQSNSDVHNTAD